MNNYDIVATTIESTVVAKYTSEQRKSTDYQSEFELEKDFINRLIGQGYQYLKIESEQDLINNLRTQLERLNDFTFFDKEWNDFYQNIIANGNDGILEKTKKFRRIISKFLHLIMAILKILSLLIRKIFTIINFK